MSTMESTEHPRPCFRLAAWVPFLVLLLGGACITLAWAIPGDDLDRGHRVVGTQIAILITGILLFGWLIFLSGLSWTLRVLIPVVLIGSSLAVVREIRFTGDMVPIFVLRWSPVHDDVLDRFRQGQASGPGVEKPAPVAGTDSFPEFRGRLRDGIATGPLLARDWQAQLPKQLWRQPIGGGYAAFAIAGNAAVTIEQRREQEAVVCYDTTTGRERWVHTYPASFQEPLGGPGPRATPTIVDDGVYSLGARGTLVHLDLKTGEQRWTVDILRDNDNLTWGMSGSPLVYDQVVVVNPGVQKPERKGRALVAYDRGTGKEVWASGGTRAGYSSPMLATLAGRRQVLLLDGESLAGYDANDGKELWRRPWPVQQGINVAQPLVLEGDRVFITSGYGVGCAMLRIKCDGGEWQIEELWRNRNMRCKFTSPVIRQGHIYGLDEGILACVDQETGQRKWRDGRFGHGQLVLSGDLLVVVSETGQMALVEATPEAYRELGRFPALNGDRTWNLPALAGGKVYLRNHVEMACYDLR